MEKTVLSLSFHQLILQETMISRILVYSFHNELTNKSIDAFSFFYIYFGFVDSLERMYIALQSQYIVYN